MEHYKKYTQQKEFCVACSDLNGGYNAIRMLLITLFLLYGTAGISQVVSVSGVIKDAQTHDSMPNANIRFVGSDFGGSSRNDGSFSVHNNKGLLSLSVSSIGYKDTVVMVDADNTENMLILLQSADINLNEVVVSGKRNKYTKKDNPAVDFIRETIARKNNNRIEAKPYYQTEQYEKLTTYLDNFNSNAKLWESFAFLRSYIDTSEISGNKILALSIKETLTDIFYRKAPKTLNEIVKAKREEGIGRDLDESAGYNMQEMFKKIDLYDNHINLLLNNFVSPLSSILATSFYKYYIADTTLVDGTECLNLAFFPFNPESHGFTGSLYITLDGTYSLKKAELHVPKRINLNFAKDLIINQTFTQLPDSTWALSEENLYVNLYLFKGIPDILVHRFRSYKDYNFEKRDTPVYESPENKTGLNMVVTRKSDKFWEENRHVPLKQKETGLERMFVELREIPLYKTIIKVNGFFSSGYFLTGGNLETSKFDIGPITSFISKNEIEGWRFRLGGMTTANLSDRLFASGYLAYGNADGTFKYNGKLTYSFNPKRYHENEFPKNNLSFMHEYDVYILGQDYLGDKDNILFSWKVGDPIAKMSYLRRTSLTYEKDWNINFRTKTWLKHQVDDPTGTLLYQWNDNGSIVDIPTLTTSELGLQLYYTIGGRPYDGRNPLFNLSKSATEFTLSHYMGIKGFLGGEWNYHRTEFSAKSRINMSAFGYIDAKFTTGKVWSKVPFPLLILPDANQSVTTQPNAFHMMRSLEFIADQYIGIHATYHANGLLFNRIPYLNWLKFREVVSFHGIYGSLSDKNHPQKTPGLYLFPDGTKPFGSAPYMEMSVGVENIFKMLGVDYFRRLSYLENDNRLRNGGVRFTFRVMF